VSPTTGDIAGMPWADVKLSGFLWLDAECGVELMLEWPPGSVSEPGRAVLSCTWVSHLTSTLDFEGGKPLTWNVSFERTADQRWQVTFDFAHRGQIAFECTAMSLRWDVPAPDGAWCVWRQDDHGNRFVVSGDHTRAEAERVCAKFEARGHKQMYWIAPQE
jgi:hypothetical protein